MNKELKATLNELSIAQAVEARNYIRDSLSEKRAASKDRKAELKAELAELTERRNRAGSDEPKKSKKSKRNKKAAE